jgi:hypothetical protein
MNDIKTYLNESAGRSAAEQTEVQEEMKRLLALDDKIKGKKIEIEVGQPGMHTHMVTGTALPMIYDYYTPEGNKIYKYVRLCLKNSNPYGIMYYLIRCIKDADTGETLYKNK